MNETEDKKESKTFDDIVESVDISNLTTKDILGDLFRSFQYISTRVAVAIRILEKMENTEQKND